MDVGDWLRGLGFGEYAEAFAENGVDLGHSQGTDQ